MEPKTTLPSFFRNTGTAIGDHIGDLQRQIDRVFSDFTGRWPRWDMGNADADFMPVIDTQETDDSVVVTAEIPGVDSKDVDVSVSGNTLTIKGEKKSSNETKKDNFYSCERSFGAFSRVIQVPFEIDGAKVDANFDKGVLTVHVRKPPGAKKDVKRIPVKAA